MKLTTISTEKVFPDKTLKSQLQVMYMHSCYDTLLLGDVSSCYHSIEVDKQTQLLRLLLWFEVDVDTGNIDLDKPIIFKKKNLNFGDIPASPITEVGLGKFFAGARLTEEGKKRLTDHRYADDF